MRDSDHIPVLLQPVIDVLFSPPAHSGGGGEAGRGSASPGGVGIDVGSPLTLLDCTAGLGGHAAAVARRLPPGSTVILSDLDAANLAHAEQRVRREAPHADVLTHHGNFAAIPRWLQSSGGIRTADLLLADLGFASPQVEDPARGLSFLRDGPLDMRLDPSKGTTAADLVASLPEPDLAQIIFEYGEERHSRAIARAVVEARKQSPITTTARFAEIVRHALRGKVPPKEVTGTDPSTKTFQALRIAVNDELGNLHALLDQIEKAARPPSPASAGEGGRRAFGSEADESRKSGSTRSDFPSARPGEGDAQPLLQQQRPSRWLSPRATVAFITFHSLEDRPVKQSFAKLVESGRAQEATPRGKPITADEAELAANPRARSAKLRAIRLKP